MRVVSRVSSGPLSRLIHRSMAGMRGDPSRPEDPLGGSATPGYREKDEACRERFDFAAIDDQVLVVRTQRFIGGRVSDRRSPNVKPCFSANPSMSSAACGAPHQCPGTRFRRRLPARWRRPVGRNGNGRSGVAGASIQGSPSSGHQNMGGQPSAALLDGLLHGVGFGRVAGRPFFEQHRGLLDQQPVTGEQGRRRRRVTPGPHATGGQFGSSREPTRTSKRKFSPRYTRFTSGSWPSVSGDPVRKIFPLLMMYARSVTASVSRTL